MIPNWLLVGAFFWTLGACMTEIGLRPNHMFRHPLKRYLMGLIWPFLAMFLIVIDLVKGLK